MTDKTLAERVAERLVSRDKDYSAFKAMTDDALAEFVLAADEVWPPDYSLSRQGAAEHRYMAALAALAKALGVER